MHLARWTPLAAALLLGACSKIAPLEGAPPTTLSPSEKADVRVQVEKASAEKDWKAAWNQEIAAGGDRAVLERIAVLAVADGSGDGEDMLEELRKRHGSLSPEGRAQVAATIRKHEAERRFEDAAEVAVATADDAPRYEEAWAIYRRTPPNHAEDVLEVIVKARKEAEEEREKKRDRGGARR